MKKLLLTLLAVTALMLTVCLSVQADSMEIETLEFPFPSGQTDAEMWDTIGLTQENVDQLKNAIITAAESRAPYVDIAAYKIPQTWEYMTLVDHFVIGDCGIFYVDLRFGYYVSDGYYSCLYLDYLPDAKIEAIEDAADALLEGIEGSSLSDLEKALLLHDRLAVHCAFNELYWTQSPDEYNPDDSSIYGCLVNRICISQGYAEAYSYLMNRLGIPARICVSFDIDHTWNIVTIDGNEYYVDVAMDDDLSDLLGRVNHNYFLVSYQALTNHYGYDFDASPSSTLYDKSFWSTVNSAFQLLDGHIYYLNNGTTDAGLYLWENGKHTMLVDFSVTSGNRWYTPYGSHYVGNFSKLGTDGDLLYFNMSKSVFSYDPATTALTEVCRPEVAGQPGYNIIGMRINTADSLIEMRMSDQVRVQLSMPEDTWQQYPLTKVTSSIKAAEVCLGTDISVNFYAQLAKADKAAQIRFTMHGETTVVDGTVDSETGLYVFPFTGITPQALGDEIKAELILGDTVLDTLDGYSVLTNCKNLLGKSALDLGMTTAQYDAMKTLIADLMEYGAAAQTYRHYKTDSLVSEDAVIKTLTPTEFVPLTAESASVMSTYLASDDTKLVGAGVLFDYENSLYFRFISSAPQYVNVVVNGETTYGQEDFIEDNGTYILFLDPMKAYDMSGSDAYTIELQLWAYTAQTLQYNLASYVYSKQNQDTAMSALAKAVYNYGLSAAAYKNAA